MWHQRRINGPEGTAVRLIHTREVQITELQLGDSVPPVPVVMGLTWSSGRVIAALRGEGAVSDRNLIAIDCVSPLCGLHTAVQASQSRTRRHEHSDMHIL